MKNLGQKLGKLITHTQLSYHWVSCSSAKSRFTKKQCIINAICYFFNMELKYK